MAKFTKFKDPSQGGDSPLVHAVGANYYCTGCGETVPGGAWLFENVEDGMVIGIVARDGGTDAAIVHKCGKVST